MTSPFACNILVTGGAGFLGRGLLRYIQRNRIAANVTVYSRDEAKHYALRARYPRVRTVLGDVCDEERLAAVMAGHDVVIHAAALKHIPESERDVSEAIRINLDGSRAVARAATRAGVRKVIGISTDKACSPRNTYGATKMLMERTFQEAQRLAGTQTKFSCVRYGNVISSTGSVVPLFHDQIARDGRVSITSAGMTRFWISIDDAVRLVERALADHKPTAAVYVARCPAMTIMDVAQAVWKLDGLGGRVAHQIIGIRPGEKLHEMLVDEAEGPYAVEDDSGYILIPSALSMAGEGRKEMMPYESSHPSHWLLPDEMASLIKDAEEV